MLDMTERFDVDIDDLDVQHISITKPRKTDDSLFGKMYQNTNDALSQLYVHLYNVEVVEHKKIKHLTKHYTILFVKIDRKTCRKFIKFDQHCINQVKANVSSWFAKALDENVIEEYYTTSVQLVNDDKDKHGGYVLKLKLQGQEEILKPGFYDLVISLKGVRFYKQRFIPEWELTTADLMERDFLNSLQSDEEESSWEAEMIEENIVPEPDIETLTMIHNDLSIRIHDFYNVISKKYEKYAEKKNVVEELLQKVKDLSVTDVMGVDALTAELDLLENAV